MSREEYFYKRRAIRAAKDLRYSEEIIATLEKAKSGVEVECIMVNARKRRHY